MRIQSFNELKYRLKSNDFQPVINRKMKSPQIDTIRDTLKVVDTSGLMKMNQEIIRKRKRNKIFDKGTIDGYTVAAIDGQSFRVKRSFIIKFKTWKLLLLSA